VEHEPRARSSAEHALDSTITRAKNLFHTFIPIVLFPRARATGACLSVCPICLESITKRAGVYQSRCQPIPHKMHKRCWSKQNQHQRSQCCVCRQLTVDDLTFYAVAELCGVSRKRITMADLTPCGRSLLETYQCNVVSRRELCSYLLWLRHDGDRPTDEVLERLLSIPGTETPSTTT
jgi:hypothetical protein